MTTRQNPTDQQNKSQWELYNSGPRELRNNVVSEFITYYGSAPSGAHESEKLWIIWRETRNPIDNQIITEFAQDGINTLRWIWNTAAFDPVPDPTGVPYHISLDNDCVFDGMGAGLPVANITALDVDDIVHTFTIVDDPLDHFAIVGNVLKLTAAVQLVDIAYPLIIKATDPDSNQFNQSFTIFVKEAPPITPINFLGELNLFEEDTIVASGTTDIISYTVPSDRKLRLRLIECFGDNIGNFTIDLNGDKIGEKKTYFTYYETQFDYENYLLEPNDVLKITVENRKTLSGLFNARLRGYQYAI